MVRDEAIPATRPLQPDVLTRLIDEGVATANITQVGYFTSAFLQRRYCIN
jgi:hypothetical protein